MQGIDLLANFFLGTGHGKRLLFIHFSWFDCTKKKRGEQGGEWEGTSPSSVPIAGAWRTNGIYHDSRQKFA
jgi:hypothetical protein